MSTLLADVLPAAQSENAAVGSIEASGLASDSRLVRAGDVFFALPGVKTDGSLFIENALAKGAAAVVCERAPSIPTSVPIVVVEDVRRALALAAARRSRQPATIVAVTGTSGKTSVAAFCRQIWGRIGLSAASLGTLGIVGPDGATSGSLTTPDPLTLHRDLDALAARGVTHLALEASSHGIEQRRLDGVRLSAAAFTNLSRDHLDFHGTLEAYLEAKIRLFTTLLPRDAPAIINSDSDMAAKVSAACAAAGRRVLTVGRDGDLIRLVSAARTQLFTDLVLAANGKSFDIRLPLAGEFQAANALVAAGLCIATGSPVQGVLDALATLEGAPGRLQLVGQRGAAPIFVDYAHKPDALEKVLLTLRPLADGKLVVVVGCGGDRDKGKRPLMGAIAARLADRVIITDDNPRSEDPRQIRHEILEGARSGPAAVIEIGDRADAIAQSIDQLRDGDVLVIAGKGHETGQIIGDKVIAFSDVECARQALHDRSTARSDEFTTRPDR